MRKLQQLKQFAFCSVGVIPQNLKRFYKKASVRQSNYPEHPSHKWQIKLDGKIVKTPLKNVLAVPTVALAHQIAQEFNEQTEVIRPSTMPLLQMARTAVDSNKDQKLRKYIEQQVLHYLQTDIVLQREDKENKLYQIQTEKFDLLLINFNKQFRTDLKVNFSFDVAPLRAEDLLKFSNYIKSMDSWHLISVQNKAENLKSTILAVAMENNQLGVETAVAYSRLEEQYQIKTYGVVEGHHDVEEQNLLENIQAAHLFQQIINSQEVIY